MPTNNNGDRPSFPTGQGQAQSEPGGEGAATPSRGNTVASRNSRRNLPAAAVGGGGGGASQSVTPPGRGGATPPPSNNMASTGPFTAETKANGLFPQMPGSGNATAGFGGALFPVASGGSSAAGNERASSGGGSLWSRITGFGSGGSRESKPPANAKSSVMPEGGGPQGLMGQAVEAFTDLGKEKTAVQMLYGHLLSDPRAMRQYPIKWYPGLNQPRVLFRWGIGIIYMEPSSGLEDRLPVLGDTGGGSGAGRGGSFDGGSAGLEGGEAPPAGANQGSSERKYKNVDTSRPDGVVLYYTGEMGEMVIDSLDKRRRHGDAFYGELLKAIPMQQPASTARTNRPNGGGGAGAGRGGGGNTMARRNQNRNLPGAAVGGGGGAGSTPAQPPPAADRRSPQSPSGRGGDTPSETAMAAPARVLDRAMGSSESQPPKRDTQGTIIPGVMLLGVGKKAALLEEAKNLGLDAMIVFNVKVSKTRSSGKTSSMTSMKIINLQNADEELVYSSKALKDTIVDELQEKGRTPVKDVVDAAFKKNADSKFKSTELPDALNSENVENRINLLKVKYQNHPLPAAIEILNYHQQRLAEDQVAIAALNELFGDDSIGDTLVLGDQRAREKAIGSWMLKNGSSDEDDDL
ncbi:MAG: hypothetical protein MK106_08195 [Mariniblastus sp.]|nr:hypothetical protein [Mariniblastus sp.]